MAIHRANPEPQTATSSAVAEASAPQMLEQLVHRAAQAGASDIHLQMRDSAASVAFRLDGVMTQVSELPAGLAERVFGRIKFLARLKTYQESLPQDGRIDREDLKATSDIRVATYPTVTGEKIVLRLFHTASVRSLGELGFPPEARLELEKFLSQTTGMLLLTGPAGSGKTTTIYACLRQLVALGGRHIITVEDPAEQIVAGVMQTEVNEARGLDFAKAARHLLRQDPQVLVIGEMRDEETAQIAVRAALTGHLVISTLHAGSCKGVFERLLVLCRDHSAVAASVELVLNQRLLRRLCPLCSGVSSERRQPTPPEARRSDEKPLQESHVCPNCLGTGYRGRLPLVEWLRITNPMRRQIAAHQLDGLAPQPTPADSARSLVQSRLTDEAEASRVTR